MRNSKEQMEIIYNDRNGSPIIPPLPGDLMEDMAKGGREVERKLSDFIRNFKTRDPDDVLTLLIGTIKSLKHRKECKEISLKISLDNKFVSPDNENVRDAEIYIKALDSILRMMRNRMKKVLAERKTRIYVGVDHGDWVECKYCERMMLVPCGADKCPECGISGCLSWVDDERQEMDVENLDTYDTKFRLSPEDYLSEELLYEYGYGIRSKER